MGFPVPFGLGALAIAATTRIRGHTLGPPGMTIAPERPARLATLRTPFQWMVLAALSTGMVALLELLGLPAAFLIGPMLAAVVCGVNGANIRVPELPFIGAQGVVGCLIAGSIEPMMLAAFLDRWPIFIGVVLATLLASGLLGAMVSRWGSLPGTTAVWGSAPGAASAMVIMADAFGADARLVAFMQYLRVMMVSLGAAVVAGLFVDTGSLEAEPGQWFPPLIWPDFALTLAVALVGALAGKYSRVPGGVFLVPLLLGSTLHLAGGPVDLQLPEWLLAASYTLIGWTIGLKFTRSILLHALRSLPQIVLAIIALMAFCAAIGMVLVPAAGIDPMTAYLATSPGGMDSIAIIAAASQTVDISFVMSLQMARFLIVLVFGPPLARLIARGMRN